MREKILEILADAEEDILTYEGNNMMEDGIINSFAVIELVSDLEDAFDIEIDAKYVIAENFANKEVLIYWIKIKLYPLVNIIRNLRLKFYCKYIYIISFRQNLL